VLVPAGGAGRSTNTRLTAGRAATPPAAAVTVTVAQPGGGRVPAAVRPLQRTRALAPTPAKLRAVARLDPVTVTRQRTLELNRAATPTDTPRSGWTRPAETRPP
jgi:hypothetical protein